MKLIKSVLQRSFTIKHKAKTYYIDYLNSDSQILGLSNRDYWEVCNKNFEELPDHKIKGNKIIPNRKELELKKKLIEFCIKHFNDYQPDPNDC